jgi:hypothetical protein
MTFSISPAAVDVIRNRLEVSSVDHPVAGMLDCSDALPVSRDMGEALSRNASEAELRKLAKREYSPDKLKFRLDVGVYSK